MACTSNAAMACSWYAVVNMSTGGIGSLSKWRASSMPSMSGMWMSVSTRSAGVVPSSCSASRPLPASPTTSRGSAAVQSSSSSRRRLRAGASSSTSTILNGVSVMRVLRFHIRTIRHANVHLVTVPAGLALQARLGVEMQREPLADVGERHLVAALMALAHLIGVTKDRVHFATAQKDINRDDPGSARRLDSVINGVFQQRLQHQWRHLRISRHVVDVPFDGQAIAETQFLQLEVLPAQLDLVGKRRKLAVVAHENAEQIRQIFQRRFRAPRLAAHQRQYRGDAVEQEMRPDAGLQRLQPRLGNRRRERFRTQLKIEQEHTRDQQREHNVAKHGASRHVGHKHG